MKYLTGLIAFGIPCNDYSCGVWNYTKQNFTDPKWLEPKESDKTLFGDWGIEKDKIIPYHEDEELFNVATHKRAYLDMLFDKRFKELEGLFFYAINDMKCREEIFDQVHRHLSHPDVHKDVYDFMSSEFGNAWLSYVQSWSSIRERVHKESDDAEQVSAEQSAGVKGDTADI